MNKPYLRREGTRTLLIPILIFALFIMMQMIYVFLLLARSSEVSIMHSMAASIGALVFNTAVNILFIRYIYDSNRLYERQKEEELKANLEHLDKKYFEIMDKELAESREINAGLLKHIEEIRASIETGELNSKAVPVDKISESIEGLRSLRFCEDPTVDMVLTLKKNRADRESIPMNTKAVVPSDTGIAELDLSSAVSNLIDNAIEAALCVKEAGKDAYVNVNISMKGKMLIIRTENPTLSDVTVDSIEDLRTTKTDIPGSHGYGLKILQAIAGRYDGELTIDMKDHISVFTMMLNCRRRENAR